MTRARLSLAIAAAASLAAATLAAAAPSAPPAGATAGPFSHAALDTVLTRFVHGERVDYGGLSRDRGALDRYLAAVATADPGPWGRAEQIAFWIDAYDAVTTKTGAYVQGGGCTTVGVAGLIQSGGFGSFSKHYGMAAAGLLEAEVVTADGKVRIANACTNSDLFWALKGGGGGTFGVVTRLTLATHPLPDNVGPVNLALRAHSDEAYRKLIAE